MVTTREPCCGTREVNSSLVDRVTDEQRREVAQTLRGLSEGNSFAAEVLDRDVYYDALVLRVIRVAVGEGDIFQRLADLIDPQTTPYICEKCGGEWPSDIMFERCPYCGAEVLDD